MKWSYFLAILCTLTLLSCNLIPKKEKKQQILDEEWQKIATNEVEEPPLFENCSTTTEAALERCFQRTITNHIKSYLESQNLAVTESINDTVWVPILITKEAEVLIKEMKVPASIQQQIPNFATLLGESIKTLPPVKPAHTRGTEVSTQYRLPIIISIEQR
ncbi:hypothetical protein [Aquimarina brevivitae]|nr:hypothetical protein [Aquimarina brevivitae]